MEKISEFIAGVIINTNSTLLGIILSIVLIALIIFFIIRYFLKCEKEKKEKEEEKNAIWQEVEKIKKETERKEEFKEAKEKLDKIFEKKEIEKEDFSFIVRWIKNIEIGKENEERLLELDILKIFAEVSEIKKQIVFDNNLNKYLYFLENSFKQSYDDKILKKIINNLETTKKRLEELDRNGYIGAGYLKKLIEKNCEEVRSRN